jgi:hypothetical protein
LAPFPSRDFGCGTWGVGPSQVQSGPVRSSQVQSGPVRPSQAQSGPVRPSQAQSASQAELRKSCRPHRWERRRNAKVTASAHGDGAARVLRIDGTAPHAQNRPAKRRHQAAAGAPSAGRIGATLTAEVEVPPPRAAKCECTSQTLAHRMMVPPATTSRMIPQSHQSFLSPDLRIACITVGQMSGSGAGGEPWGGSKLISLTVVTILPWRSRCLGRRQLALRFSLADELRPPLPSRGRRLV